MSTGEIWRPPREIWRPPSQGKEAKQRSPAKDAKTCVPQKGSQSSARAKETDTSSEAPKVRLRLTLKVSDPLPGQEQFPMRFMLTGKFRGIDTNGCDLNCWDIFQGL